MAHLLSWNAVATEGEDIGGRGVGEGSCIRAVNAIGVGDDLLDVIGDLSLLGLRLQGRIIAYKPGHTFNTQCVRRLRNQILSE